MHRDNRFGFFSVIPMNFVCRISVKLFQWNYFTNRFPFCFPRLGTSLSVQSKHKSTLRLRRPFAIHSGRVRQATGRGSRQKPLLSGWKKSELSASDRSATVRAAAQKVLLREASWQVLLIRWCYWFAEHRQTSDSSGDPFLSPTFGDEKKLFVWRSE